MGLGDLQQLRDKWQQDRLPLATADTQWLMTPNEHQMRMDEMIDSLSDQYKGWQGKWATLPERAEVSTWISDANVDSHRWDVEDVDMRPEVPPLPENPKHVSSSAVSKTFPKKPDPDLDIEDRAKVYGRFWKDTWADDAGNIWQVQMDMCKDMRSRNGITECGGGVFLNGDHVGEWSRHLKLQADPPQIKHSLLQLDGRVRGKGFAKAWLSRCAERYERWGVEEVTLETGWSGAATWPKMGFDLAADDNLRYGEPSSYKDSDYSTQMKNILKSMRTKAGFMREKGSHQPLDPEKKQALIALIDRMSQDPDGPPRLPEIVKQYPELCKALTYSYIWKMRAPNKALLQLDRSSPSPRLEDMGQMAASSPEQEKAHQLDLGL